MPIEDSLKTSHLLEQVRFRDSCYFALFVGWKIHTSTSQRIKIYEELIPPFVQPIMRTPTLELHPSRNTNTEESDLDDLLFSL